MGMDPVRLLSSKYLNTKEKKKKMKNEGKRISKMKEKEKNTSI